MPTSPEQVTSADQLIKQIAADEDSVRANGTGRNILLDDLRRVAKDQTRSVFEKVYESDKSQQKTTVIDISNGTLIISDPYNRGNINAGTANNASDTGSSAKQAPNTEDGLLKRAFSAWKQLPLYEKIMAAGTGVKALQLGNTVAGGVIDELINGPDAPADTQKKQIEAEIQWHQAHDDQETLLGHFVGRVAASVWSHDHDSLAALKQAEKQSGPVDVAGLIATDRHNLQTRDEIEHYGANFIKTAALFMQGTPATCAYAALSGLDQAQMGSPLSTQILDLGIGATKGFAIKGLYSSFGKYQLGLAGTAVGLSIGSQFLNTAMNRQTYIDQSTGDFSLIGGVGTVLHNTLDPKALAINALMFAASQGAVKGFDAWAGTNLAANHIASTVFTAGTMGATSGAVTEVEKERANHESFNIGKVLGRSLLEAGLDGLAAIPGGVQPYSSMAALKADLSDFRDSMSLVRWKLISPFHSSPLPLALVTPAMRAVDLAKDGQYARADRLAEGHFKTVEETLGKLNSVSEDRIDELANAFEREGQIELAAKYRQMIPDAALRADAKSGRGVSEGTISALEDTTSWLTDHNLTDEAAETVGKSVDAVISSAKGRSLKYESAHALDTYAYWYQMNGHPQEAAQTLEKADKMWSGLNSGRDGETAQRIVHDGYRNWFLDRTNFLYVKVPNGAYGEAAIHQNIGK